MFIHVISNFEEVSRYISIQDLQLLGTHFWIEQFKDYILSEQKNDTQANTSKISRNTKCTWKQRLYFVYSHL